MTLFTMLVVLALERVFKRKDCWQLDNYLAPLYVRCSQGTSSMIKTLGLIVTSLLAVWLIISLTKGFLLGLLTLIFIMFICFLSIGSGRIRVNYRRYLIAVESGDRDAIKAMIDEISPAQKQQGLMAELTELQNTFIWINYRYYLAPLFWFLALGSQFGIYGITLYAVLRGYQTWLVQYASAGQRAQSGVDKLLDWLDWIPVRLAGIVYALIGHGEKALPAWIAALGDFHTSPHRCLTQLAQFSLSKEPHTDPILSVIAAVRLAKKATLILIVIVALITIYGGLT